MSISNIADNPANRTTRWLLPAVLSGVLLPGALLVTACATPLKPVALPESRALVPESEARAWAPLHDNLPDDRNTSWFHIQDVGPEALRWRLAMIDTATVSLDAQYFIWNADASGLLLLDRFLEKYSRNERTALKSVSSDVKDLFLSYGWPGNVRELENAVDDTPIADLVDGINDVAGAGTYAYVATGAIGTERDLGIIKASRIGPDHGLHALKQDFVFVEGRCHARLGPFTDVVGHGRNIERRCPVIVLPGP